MGNDHRHSFRQADLLIRSSGVVLLIVTMGALNGCRSQPPRGEVTGTVRVNGQPLANVLVTFHPDPDHGAAGTRSAGVTNAQGRYSLHGEDQQNGAVAGRHRVVVEDLSIYSAPRGPEGMVLRKPPLRFPADYGDPLKTPLRKEVRPGPQTIDLDLSAAP
jgi:hypothetical protein